MHAKTAWDVLIAGCLVVGGANYLTLIPLQAERMTWYRRLGYMIAAVGFVSWGIGWVTLPRESQWPFILIGIVGSIVGSSNRAATGGPKL